jgi:pimeloyl-ACP methyl ester carboxylesterase
MLQDEQGALVSGYEQTAGARVHFTERIPKDIDEALGTIVIVPGYYGLKWTYGEFRDALAAQTQRRVRTYRHDRFEGSLGLAMHPDNILHPDRLGKKSATLMIDSAYRYNPAAPITMVGHSMGGPHAVDATLRRTNKVDGVVLFGSAGLEPGQNSVRMGLRLPGVIMREVIPTALSLATQRRDKRKLAAEAMLHGLSHPWRLIGEAVDVSNRPFMEPELTLLNRDGVCVYVIHLEDDGFFPFARSGVQAAGRLATRVELVRGANHLLTQDEPEAAADAVVKTLSPQVYLAAAA